jgi:carboxylate-amine ligase
MTTLPAGAGEYDAGDCWDEAFAAPGVVREHYLGVLEALAEAGPARAAAAVQARLLGRGVEFGGERGAEFVVDPVPRLLAAHEWDELAAGLRQRVLALDAFVADVQGERRAIAEGVVPEEVVTGSAWFEPSLRGLQPAGGARVAIAGLDVVRGGDGRFRVLEDNLRTPSGSAYAIAASDAVQDALGVAAPQDTAAAVGAALRRCLQATNPDGEGELILLTDGEANSAYYEHVQLARLAGLRVTRVEELRRRGAALELRDGGRVRAVYRRTDDDRLCDETGEPTALAELLLEPLRAGTIGLANWYGTGVADDKGLYPYVHDLVRLYLGEEPQLRSVTTYDLADEAVRDDVLGRLGELALKPRDGQGGAGVTVGPTASRAELDDARAALLADPGAWIAQEPVTLSTHPTVVGDRIEPRHVDLRPFAFCDGEDVTVVPGGLTRVALERGSMVVNSSRDGGGKATWVCQSPARSSARS